MGEGSGAAAGAEKYVADFRLPETAAQITPIDVSGPPRIGVFLCHCGINIAGVLDIETMAEYVRGLPGVVHVQDDLFLCADGSQKGVWSPVATVAQHPVSVVAGTQGDDRVAPHELRGRSSSISPNRAR